MVQVTPGRHTDEIMTGSMRALVALLTVAGLGLPAGASAAGPDPAGQATGNASRPKICLALSGGGARGAAHIGVLKVLEEMHIPIDCIAGTSMGALVGGAYASGMSVDEMDTITTSITRELLFKENPPRRERSMRRKQDDYDIYIGPEIAYKAGSFGFAKGLVSGVQLETVLRGLSRVKGNYRFDDLPIPYRAVATDLVTGKAVVFEEGELANVMRASMAVPGAVAPAEFGGMMLVDGMLTENLPVQTARAMGADIVIAVNVGTPLLKREQLSGIIGVTAQMLSILTEQNVQASLAALQPQDILIAPELGDYTTGDFDELAKIAPLGEAAARKVADRLSRLAMPAAQYAELRKRQQVQIEPDVRPVDEIRFADLKQVNPETVRAAMDTQPGRPIDQQTLDRDMRRIYGMGYFEHVNYRFLEEPGRRVLVVDAAEKTWGQNSLRFGLGLITDLKGDAFFNLIGSYRKAWLNPLGGEWRSTLQFGRTSSFTTEFYQPIRAQGDFFVAPNFSYERRTSDLYRGDQRIATYDTASALAGVDAGGLFGRYGEARLGLKWGTMKPKLDTGPVVLTPAAGDVAVGAATLRIVLDRFDSVHFPRDGWRAGLKVFDSIGSLGADVDYTKWDFDGAIARSFGDHTFNLGWKFGGKLGNDPLPRYDLFQWGGFLQQSGYATGQLLGEKMSFGRLMYYHRIMRGGLLEGAYSGLSLEAGKVGNPLVPGAPTGTLHSASLFIGADTPLGPAYFGYGRASDGNSSWYLFLGRIY